MDEGDEEVGDDEDDAGTGARVSSPDEGGSSGRAMTGEDENEPIDEDEGLLHAAASAGAPGSGAQHCFVVFDQLFLNGQVLTHRPLQERRALLEQAFTPQRGSLSNYVHVIYEYCTSILINTIGHRTVQSLVLRLHVFHTSILIHYILHKY